ncbi:MAG: ATP-dependent DNA ligase [Planctomycetota bacterium]|nr:MAG: ATP-dependent DNA ligase [Planctomycetota bacterium]
MRQLAQLYQTLDETTKTARKVDAMTRYFAHCDPADGAWVVSFLSGRRFKRLIKSSLLRQWSAEVAGLPDWLFDECYRAVGDLAETMALLQPAATRESQQPLHYWVEERIRPLAGLSEAEQKTALLAAWADLSTHERFVFNKLVTGEFRVGVSEGLVKRALAKVSGLEAAVIAHRLMGQWEPTPEFFVRLMAADDGTTKSSQPYPFCLAHPLQDDPQTLGAIGDWLVEWKWDGIRAQIIRRCAETFIWSRGEELIHERFPELLPAADSLADGTLLDGEIVGWKNGRALPFQALQRRIGRKTVGKKLLAEVPVKFIAFDLLEAESRDVRDVSLCQRRRRLELCLGELADDSPLMVSPLVTATDWENAQQLRETSREDHVEGLMLKRADSNYGVGRHTGQWWKWKVNPYTCDAVLMYAQRGHGRRASLYTDYTFGAWHEGELVPFAKAYSGLTDAEIREVDRFVRKNTTDKFGPVRAVKPELVFELAFENIGPSKRHKSGIAVRFPRMHRWRLDKKPRDADTLDSIKALMPGEEPA